MQRETESTRSVHLGSVTGHILGFYEHSSSATEEDGSSQETKQKCPEDCASSILRGIQEQTECDFEQHDLMGYVLSRRDDL